MAWSAPPPAPPAPGWWVEWQYHWHVARGRADRQARERDRRRAEIARTVTRARELTCLAETSAESTAHYLKATRGATVERRSAGPDVGPFVGRPVSLFDVWAAGLVEGKDYTVKKQPGLVGPVIDGDHQLRTK
jgi:hypothetical protein